MSNWWTDERIDATINRDYVCSHLTRDEQERLDKLLGFGDGLTDDTYLDWILTRARRLFLILVDIGVPDQIFYIVDESYDDEDLPIAADTVRNLRLTYEKDATLEKRFFKTQFRYLVRSIKEGEHVHYGDEEAVPIKGNGQRASIPNIGKDGVDKVALPGPFSKVYTRRRVVLNDDPEFLAEDDVLAEVNSMKQIKHEHLISVYGSYTHADITYVLMLPSAEWTLKSFLSDPPQHFKNLEKRERREVLIKWPHCLASALSYLHIESRHHGGIRPSNVLVDANHRIFFGCLDIYRLLRPDKAAKDVEAYEYAAPESWVRAPVVQQTARLRTTLHSGGRTARKMSGSSSPAPSSGPNSATSKSQRSSYSSDGSGLSPTLSSGSVFSHFARKSPPLGSLDASRPSTSTTTPARSDTASFSSSSQASTILGRPRSKSSKWPLNYTPSIASSNSSQATTRPATSLPSRVAVPSPTLQSAIISTWQSQQHDPMPSDIFAFGTITLEILTLICKRKLSSFVWHRSCKNRTAGRGGAPSDASYHANLKQVGTWIKALKKISFDKEDEIFRAVEKMLDTCGAMIVKEPEDRPSAETIEGIFADALAIGNTKPHCRDHGHEPRPAASETRPLTAVRRSIDSTKSSKRNGLPEPEDQPPVPPLPPKLRALLRGRPSGPLPTPPAITDLKTENSASSSSLSSMGFNFETSLYMDDFEDEEDDDRPDLSHSGPLELPRQDSMTAIPDFNFPPPIRHSSIINPARFDVSTAGGDSSFGPGFVRTRTPQSGMGFGRNWPLPSAHEIDEAFGA